MVQNCIKLEFWFQNPFFESLQRLTMAFYFPGGFSDSEVGGLESEDLQFISSEAIQALPPSKFSKLSADLIGELDSEQAQSVTDAQISELSASQKNALAGAGSGGTGGGDGDGGGNNTGSTTVEPSGKSYSLRKEMVIRMFGKFEIDSFRDYMAGANQCSSDRRVQIFLELRGALVRYHYGADRTLFIFCHSIQF